MKSTSTWATSLQNPARDALGIMDDDTYFELLDFHHERLVDMADYLTTSRDDWTMLFIETHASDYTSHFFLGQAEAFSGADAETQQRCLDGVIRTYSSIDSMIGRVAAIADEETLICLVSDHGGTPNQYRAIEIDEVLEEAGFLVYKEEDGKRTVDWSRTRAASVGLVHVFINLEGREPEGIVSPADYKDTQLEIIAALHAYTDPATGRHPFALALTREDAEMVNLWGDTTGDVVYALRPEFDGAHGKQLPLGQLWHRRTALHLCPVRSGRQGGAGAERAGAGGRRSPNPMLPTGVAHAPRRGRWGRLRGAHRSRLAPQGVKGAWGGGRPAFLPAPRFNSRPRQSPRPAFQYRRPRPGRR